MKKEIKFRAWIAETKERVNNFENDYAISELNNDFFIIEQFTGLVDKNGIEIFEGDILKTKFGNKIFFSDLLDYHLWNLKSVDAFSKIQVIGNIHENPELI